MAFYIPVFVAEITRWFNDILRYIQTFTSLIWCISVYLKVNCASASFIKHYVMKTYSYERAVVQISSRLRWAVSFTLLPLYPRGNCARYLFHRAPEFIYTLWIRQKSYFSWKSNPGPQPVNHRCSEWATSRFAYVRMGLLITHRDQIYIYFLITLRPPLWSSGQSFGLQIQSSRVRFSALPHFLRMGSTQPRENNWGATWMKK
jgi:hypothetical protein